ncbi:MAG: hypothetical protein LUC95_10630, partial [Lachnospiraceae bacterium]|nr:hypothetical protein [Lachnospiraceae bacterium]
MATDYRKQIEKDASAAKSLEPAERKKVRERLQVKVGKEPMTVKEVAAWIELTDRDGESFTVIEKTIKNYINSLCKMRKELKIEYFKNDQGEYIIKPEIQGL